MEQIEAAALAERLSGPAGRGELVLFTGAGFSAGTPNVAGGTVPTAHELRTLIWDLAFDGAVDDDSTLQEVFEVARRERADDLARLLRDHLSIAPDKVAPQQVAWLAFPWRRAYTVNIDDLELSASANVNVTREIVSLSALRDETPPDSPRALAWIHLNGDLRDVPNVTFSEQQYGVRTTREDPLYSRLVTDLTIAPVIFVGSTLREAQLWRYIALRQLDDPDQQSLQPASYLVAPSLARARQSLLSAMNIVWVRADAAEFANEVLSRLTEEAQSGRRSLALTADGDPASPLRSVGDLLSAASPRAPSLYLEGAQPSWDDIAAGRTAARAFDSRFPIESASGTVLVTSTAGEGTSTTLMRFAARLHAEGRETLWASGKEQPSGQRLRAQIRVKAGSFALVLDDADMLGFQLEHLIRDFTSEPNALLLLGMRSSRVDAAMPTWDPNGPRSVELNVPKLQDADIDELLLLLERENRLGLLTPRTPSERARALSGVAGRLLLVAMLLVTEGHDLRQKVEEEYSQLAQPQRGIYGVIALASQYRYRVTGDEALQAAVATTAVGATALERLRKRGLVIEPSSGYECRHRTVAELVVRRMRDDGTLAATHGRLLSTVASRHSRADLRDPRLRQRSPRYRLAQTLMNHRTLDGFRIEEARQIYADAEPYLASDYHYWLQRGSYEVRRGSLAQAERYLQRCRLEGGDADFRVDVEWYYMLLKGAASKPRTAKSKDDAAEAYAGLLHIIDERGTENEHPFTVLLSQYPRWLTRSELSMDEKRQRFETLRILGDRALVLHGYDSRTSKLRRELEKQYLSLSVAAGPSTAPRKRRPSAK
ncbi:MAG TPA: hypothetical protein VFR48_06805, partial [Solirubrobacteraceae bacterium]|nr:hypothetical protein [Solirubrobacteraceae bacterium]